MTNKRNFDVKKGFVESFKTMPNSLRLPNIHMFWACFIANFICKLHLELGFTKIVKNFLKYRWTFFRYFHFTHMSKETERNWLDFISFKMNQKTSKTINNSAQIYQIFRNQMGIVSLLWFHTRILLKPIEKSRSGANFW